MIIKEIPILFSPLMVDGIVEGRKLQTRRLLTDPVVDLFITPPSFGFSCFTQDRSISVRGRYMKNGEEHYGEFQITCPFGKNGDRLWVREEHYRYGTWGEIEGEYTKTGKQKVGFFAFTDEVLFNTNPPSEFFGPGKPSYSQLGKVGWYKRLARFMPKRAARIWLEVVSIRAERLQSITREDAVAEGICLPNGSSVPVWYQTHRFPEENFQMLWSVINGVESWAANPWILVVKFKVLTTNGKL
jgi:hypothetical protein